MSITDPYLVNTDLNLHMRDARHAHNLYTEHTFALAPKAKFLYHVLFQPRPDVGDNTTKNTFKFQKEIGVLAKNTDLPSFRVSVENKQQYNRKKNVQTRIDYQDVNITLHDDNTGITRSLLEEYYRYYFNDGNLDINKGAFAPRDINYETTPKKYGLSTGTVMPFFANITIYQLARRKWNAYTLVNPLLTQWDHGNMDQSAGAEFNEHKITVAYESVLYTRGEVNEQGEPIGFGDADTRYDQVMSPITYKDEQIATNIYNMPDPALINDTGIFGLGNLLPRVNNTSQSSSGGLLDTITGFLGGGLSQTRVPNPDSQNTTTISNALSRDVRSLDGATISRELRSNASARQSFVNQALNSGDAGVSRSDFNNLSSSQQGALTDSLIDSAGSSTKLKNMASQAISASRG